MGADATILFNGVESKIARSAIAAAAAEIDRLEDALSLFRADLELRRLNREKVLHSPSGDLRRALALALDIAGRSGGLFDPSVQALWEAYVDWFAAAPDAGLPPDGVIAKALAAVDWRRILIGPDTVRAGDDQRLDAQRPRPGLRHRPGSRILDSMRGLKHIFVDLGEAARDRATSGRRAMARRARPRRSDRTNQRRSCDLRGCGLHPRRFRHCARSFDPRSGRSASHWKKITVHHRSCGRRRRTIDRPLRCFS